MTSACVSIDASRPDDRMTSFVVLYMHASNQTIVGQLTMFRMKWQYARRHSEMV